MGKTVYASYKDVPPEIQSQFQELVCALSPENLSCDGEATGDEVQVRYNALMEEWHALELQIGLSVSKMDAWG